MSTGDEPGLGLAATHGFLSLRRDCVIAVDGHGRVALAQGHAGSMRPPTIVRLEDITVEAREAGQPLDELEPARRGPAAGVLVLRVRHAERVYDISFAQRGDETDPEYDTVRDMLAWWRDTLLGKTPVQPYRVAPRLAAHAAGSLRDEAEEAEVRRILETYGVRVELPEARVVKMRDR